MFELYPLFSLWVGPGAADFTMSFDTLFYTEAKGLVLKIYKEGGKWFKDTLLKLPPGMWMVSACPPFLYLTSSSRVLIYKDYELKEKFRLPFNPSGALCRADTLFLYDAYHLYMWVYYVAPKMVYRSEEEIKDVFLRGNSLFILQANHILKLNGVPDTIVKFDGFSDMAEAYPIDGSYVLRFESGDVILYHKGKGEILAHSVEKMGVWGDTLLLLTNDSLKAYLLRRWKR